jgi:hypothetical protein
MRKLALSLISAGAFAAIAMGVSGPAMAEPDYVTPGHDPAYSTNPHSTTVRPVDCAVHVNTSGSDAAVNWC